MSGEIRSIEVTFTGRVDLHILLLGPARDRRLWTALEEAVRKVEAFMGFPLPTGAVTVLFADAAGHSRAGTNTDPAMIVLPKIQDDDQLLHPG